MQIILDKIIDGLTTGNVLIVVVVAAVALIFNAQKILEFVERRKQIRIENLEKALCSEYVNGLTKEHLKEELEAEYYNLTTGIYKNKKFREAIIEAYNSSDGSVNFTQFKRALPHIKFHNSKLSVVITKTEKAFFYFFNVFGFMLLVFGLLLFVIPGISKGETLLFKVTIMGMGVYFVAMSVIMLAQSLPVRSAKIVKKMIERTHNNSVNSDG